MRKVTKVTQIQQDTQKYVAGDEEMAKISYCCRGCSAHAQDIALIRPDK
jgi:hypothetical protein